jgi:pimeloyl-ACP methyl ester carboxylesterase
MPSIGRVTYLDVPSRVATAKGRAQETLLLIHGFPLGARMWEPQLALADHGWRIIVPQLRGFDGTAGDPPVESIDDYAGDIIDLLDGLRIDEAVIGGLSMGGYITFALFRLAHGYFRGMVLADTRPQADSPEGLEARRRMLTLVQEKGAGAVADDMLPKLLGQSAQSNRAIVHRTRSLIEANATETITGAIRALMSRPDSSPLLSSIHCPTLIIVGEEDVITPPKLSEDMHHAIGGSELVVIRQAGHLSNLEQPDAFNAALVRFLEHRV